MIVLSEVLYQGLHLPVDESSPAYFTFRDEPSPANAVFTYVEKGGTVSATDVHDLRFRLVDTVRNVSWCVDFSSIERKYSIKGCSGMVIECFLPSYIISDYLFGLVNACADKDEVDKVLRCLYVYREFKLREGDVKDFNKVKTLFTKVLLLKANEISVASKY